MTVDPTPAPDPRKPPPVGIEKVANAAWLAVGQFPGKLLAGQKKYKAETPPTKRASNGCIGVLFFGVAYFFLPLIVIVLGEAVLLAWALLVTLAWGISVLIQRKKRPLGSQPPGT